MTRRIEARALAYALTPLCVLLVAGCVGYRLGTSLPPGIRTVHVSVFENKTAEPAIEFDTTQATVREFQREGTLRVAAADEADLLVAVTLLDYSLQPLGYRKDRATTANEYRITLTASLTLTERKTGRLMYAGQTVIGDTTFTVESDLAEAKRAALPLAARHLAHQLVKRVVEYW